MPLNASSSFRGRRGPPPEMPFLALSIPYLPFYGPYMLFLTASQLYAYSLALARLALNLTLLFFPDESLDFLDLLITGPNATFLRLFATRSIVLAALLFVASARYGKRYLRGSLAVMRLVLWANVANDMIDFGTVGCAGVRGDIPARAAQFLLWATLTCLNLGLIALVASFIWVGG